MCTDVYVLAIFYLKWPISSIHFWLMSLWKIYGKYIPCIVHPMNMYPPLVFGGNYWPFQKAFCSSNGMSFSDLVLEHDPPSSVSMSIIESVKKRSNVFYSLL